MVMRGGLSERTYMYRTGPLISKTTSMAALDALSRTPRSRDDDGPVVPCAKAQGGIPSRPAIAAITETATIRAKPIDDVIRTVCRGKPSATSGPVRRAAGSRGGLRWTFG